MSSMRYVRGSGEDNRDNQDYTHGRGSSRSIMWGGRGRSSRARGQGGRGGRFGRGRGAGRFSGRGSGGFPSSYSFVRGTSAGLQRPLTGPNKPEVSAHKWVRNTGKHSEDESKNANISVDEKLRVETTAPTPAPVASLPDSNNTKSAHIEPINSSFERRGKHKLVITRKDAENAPNDAVDTMTTEDTEGAVDEIAQTAMAAVTDNADASSEGVIMKTNSSFERRGKHKLVIKRNDFAAAADNAVTADPAETEQKPNNNEEHQMPGGSELIEGLNATRNTAFMGNNTWKRQSSQLAEDDNKVINDPGENQNKVLKDELSDAASETDRAQIEKDSMERHGFGKLVLKGGDSSKRVDRDMSRTTFPGNKSRSWKHQTSERAEIDVKNKPDNPIRKETRWQDTKSAKYNGKRKQANHSASPRRISLAQPSISKEGTINDMQDGEETNSPDGEHDEYVNEAPPSSDTKMPPSEKTLTDFCYKTTGRGGGRGRGRGRGHHYGRGGRGKAGRSMGLVRVKPHNPSSTPICPTFRRGLPCNNPKCTLRHDVSTEASRPICVFFQRNGMCSKGDSCPFRHVKVRWDAEVCPMFERMGYCEDPDCVLRHVLAKKSRVEAPRK